MGDGRDRRKTVWVVHNGDGHHFWVWGIFSTREAAEEYMRDKNRGHTDFIDADEWPLDAEFDLVAHWLEKFRNGEE